MSDPATRLGARGAAAALALLFSIAACSDGRSTEAYCDTFYEKGGEIRDRAIEANENEDMLAIAANTLRAPRDIHNLFADLAEAAPEEIRDDVETLRDAYGRIADEMGDSVSDPLAVLGTGVMTGIEAAPAERRVNAWMADNCGPPPAD